MCHFEQMTTNPYRSEAFGGYHGVPLRVSSINTQDSGYVTDLVQHMTLDPPIKPALTPPRKQSKKNKTHKCRMCAVDKRFSTKNDLIRHMKTFHAILKKGDKVWLCPVSDCTSAGKRWPRFDNFRQHVLKQHGEEFMDKLEHSYEIIMIEQSGGRKSSTPKQYNGQVQAENSTIDPRLLDDTSEFSPDHDATSTTFDQATNSPADYVVTRHSPTNSSQCIPRSAQSYPFRPALTAAAKAFDGRLFPLRSQSPLSTPSQRGQPRPSIPSPAISVFDCSPIEDMFEQGSSQQIIPMEEVGTGRDSFLEYYDAHIRHTPTGSPDELTAVGTSFIDCAAPSLTNTGSTRTSVDQLDELQSMQSIALPSTDFEMITGSNPLLSTRRSDPIPQLKITTVNPYDVRSSPACYLQTSKTPGRLLPQHWCPAGYSPETLLSSMSDGETSFVFYDATHDLDAKPDSATSTFVEELASRVLEAYQNQTPPGSNETTRPSTGGGQENSSSRRQTQSSGGTDNPRKRKANRTPDRRRQSHGDHEDEEEEDQNPGGNSDNKRARTGHGDILLACPFYKRDPLNHPHCAVLVLRSIPALKQHLHRKHRRPDHYCPRCFADFPAPEGLFQHQRQSNQCFVIEEDPYADLMTATACLQIQRRSSGNPGNVWYEVYEILFPNQPRPESPFSDDQASMLHVLNIFCGFGPAVLHWLVAMRRSIPAPSRAIYEQALQRFIDLYNQNQAQQHRRPLGPTRQIPGTLTPDSLPMSLPNMPQQPLYQGNPHAEIPLFGMVPANNVLAMNAYQQQYNAPTLQANNLDPNIINAGGWLNLFEEGTMPTPNFL